MPNLRWLTSDEQKQRASSIEGCRVVPLNAPVAHPWLLPVLARLHGLSARQLDRVLQYQAGFGEEGSIQAVGPGDPDDLRLLCTGPTAVRNRSIARFSPQKRLLAGLFADGPKAELETYGPHFERFFVSQIVVFAAPNPALYLTHRVASAHRANRTIAQADRLSVIAGHVTALFENGFLGGRSSVPTQGMEFADEPLADSFSDLIPLELPDLEALWEGTLGVSEQDAASPWWLALGIGPDSPVPFTSPAAATRNGRLARLRERDRELPEEQRLYHMQGEPVG